MLIQLGVLLGTERREGTAAAVKVACGCPPAPSSSPPHWLAQTAAWNSKGGAFQEAGVSEPCLNPADESLCAAVPIGHGLGRPGKPVNSQTRVGVQSLGLVSDSMVTWRPLSRAVPLLPPGTRLRLGHPVLRPGQPQLCPLGPGPAFPVGCRRWGPRQCVQGACAQGSGDLQTAALPLSLADLSSHQGTPLYLLLLFSASTGSEKYHRSFSASENTHFKN